MNLRIKLLCLGILTITMLISCNPGASVNEEENKGNYVPRVEEESILSWRHIENLPRIRPIAALMVGVLNDNWDRIQYQLDRKPFDILQEFSNVFHYSPTDDDQNKINDVIVMPVQATAEEPLAISGTRDEIINAMKEKINLHNFNTGILMRIDYYEPGAKFSPSGVEYNPEMKLTFWFVNAEGKIIWTAQTAVRTIQPLPPNVAIDYDKSIFALLNRAYEEVKNEFLKFWKSPEVIARMQAAKVVDFKRPLQPEGTTGSMRPEFSRPLSDGTSTLKGAGFSENSD